MLKRDRDVDLATLQHWHPGFRQWKTWDDVPAEIRDVFATDVERKADEHAGTAQRCVGLRPQQQQFEQMWSYVARMAAERLR